MNTPSPRSFRRTILALSIASLLNPAFAQQEQTEKLQEKQLKAVEVVGTSPLPGLGIEKDKLPYDVQTATNEQVHQSQTMNLTEYMSRNLLGVNINEVQGSPFQADITYRGFRLSGILGSSQGLSVYLDGVRVNEPFGDVVNWDMIPEAAINNVTLVPGSNPIYGLNTLGGALAFTTKSGLIAPGTEVKLQAGSFGRVRADVAYGSKSDDGYHSFISATGFREDGWRDYSAGNLGNVFAKIGRQQNDSNWDLALLVGRSNMIGNGLLPSHGFGNVTYDGTTRFNDRALGADNDLTAARTPGMYETNRRWVYTHPDRTENQLNMLTFNLQRMLDSATELATTAYVRSSKRQTIGGDAEREAEWASDAPNALFDDYQTQQVLNRTTTSQTSYGGSLNLTKALSDHHLTTGTSVDVASVGYGATQATCGELSANREPINCGTQENDARVKGKSYSFGLYASDTWSVSDRTFITSAARFNHARVSNTLTNWEGGVAEQKPRESFNYNSLNPSLGVSHKLSDAFNVFGNVGQSNRVPTVIELGCADPDEPCRLPTGLQADPYLKQVIARTIEGGIRYAFSENTGISASVYRSENKDDILFRAVGATGLGYFSNFSRTRRQGVDLSGYTSLGSVAIRAGYSYLDATYQADDVLFGGERDVVVKPGTKIAGLPEHTLKISADWRIMPRLVFGGTLMAVSSLVTQGNEDGYIGADNTNKIEAKAKVSGYSLLNLHARYEADKQLEYFARVNNVFDTRFESYGMMAMSMFNADGSQLASGDPATVSRFVAPGAPRSFMVGVRYRY